MHYIEHIIYFSCIFIPLIFNIQQHPIHILFNKYHALISPLPGHDGFDEPGGASYCSKNNHKTYHSKHDLAKIISNTEAVERCWLLFLYFKCTFMAQKKY